MRAIQKNLQDIPASIRVPAISEFPDSQMQAIAEGTEARRKALLDEGRYIHDAHYDAGYKQSDVRDALKALYHGKCAYCEQKIEEWHVEHYRPKSRYYWLAYAWDNLLLACVKCNRFKGDKFKVSGIAIGALDPETVQQDIHTQGAAYDLREQPLLVNPEREQDPLTALAFDRLGRVVSNEPRYAHTIEVCKLSRKDLCDSRRFILDEFRSELEAVAWGMATMEPAAREQAILIKLKEFIGKANDPSAQYTAFRKYVVQNWLLEIAQEAR